MSPIQETSISLCHQLDWSTKEGHTGNRVHLGCFFSVMNLMLLLENSTVSREQNNTYSLNF